jgi:hypothetical protein
LTVPAFWFQGYTSDGARPDGPAGWRARCTVAVPGRWSFVAALASGLTGEPLSVEVGPAGGRGFIRLSKTGFGYDDSSQFMPVGANIAWSRAADPATVLAEADDPTVDPEGIHWHNGLWAAPFTGFAGPAMYWWWDEYLDPRQAWGNVRGIASFLAGEVLSSFAPVRATVSGDVVALALGRPDRVLAWVRAAAYSRDGAQSAFAAAAHDALGKGVPLAYEYQPPSISSASLTLRGLAAGGWRVRWLSTADGSVVMSSSTVSSARRSPSPSRRSPATSPSSSTAPDPVAAPLNPQWILTRVESAILVRYRRYGDGNVPRSPDAHPGGRRPPTEASTVVFPAVMPARV